MTEGYGRLPSQGASDAAAVVACDFRDTALALSQKARKHILDLLHVCFARRVNWKVGICRPFDHGAIVELDIVLAQNFRHDKPICCGPMTCVAIAHDGFVPQVAINQR